MTHLYILTVGLRRRVQKIVCSCAVRSRLCNDRVFSGYVLMWRRYNITKLFSVMPSPATCEHFSKPMRPVPCPIPAFAAGRGAARAAHAAPQPHHAAAHQGGHHQGPAAAQDGQHRVLPAGAHAETRVQVSPAFKSCTVVHTTPYHALLTSVNSACFAGKHTFIDPPHVPCRRGMLMRQLYCSVCLIDMASCDLADAGAC